MTTLKNDLNLQDADGFYEQLLDTHRDLTEQESAQLNARLILVLANQVGDAGKLTQCLELAARPWRAKG
jgi:hypothetical protein